MIYLLWQVSRAPLKHIYYGFMSRCCRTSQKTIPIAEVPKNAAIDPMYGDGPKKHCNMRHIAAVFAPTTIVQISCSDNINRQKKI